MSQHDDVQELRWFTYTSSTNDTVRSCTC